jgi:hypothetical protein
MRCSLLVFLFCSSIVATGTVDHPVEQLQRLFNGTYTIVNKASGRKILSGTRGFFASNKGAISTEHLWRLEAQGNSTYSIVNVGNGMRILAQQGSDNEQGFFAIDNGPVFQDQRWLLELQSDGSYLLVNARSGRRILASKGHDTSAGFAAVNRAAPVLEDQMWWLINQERDETGRLFVQLAAERDSKAQLASAVERQRSMVSHLVAESSSHAGDKAKLEAIVKESGETVLRLQARLEIDRRVNVKLAEQVDFNRDKSANTALKLEEALEAGLQLAADYNETASALAILRHAGPTTCQLFIGHDMAWPLLVVALAVSLAFLPCCARKLVLLRRDVSRLKTEVDVEKLEASALAREVAEAKKKIMDLAQADEELEGMTESSLGIDFGHKIFDMELDGDSGRLIKVQCPGVEHNDIEIELVYNGCDVTIHRRASQGVEASTWRKRFQFKPSDGLFEFREDQMLLERGFLLLAFRAYNFQSRAIRFPQHYSMDDGDCDLCWEYPDEETAGECVSPNARKPRLVCKGSEPDLFASADTESTGCTEPAC